MLDGGKSQMKTRATGLPVAFLSLWQSPTLPSANTLHPANHLPCHPPTYQPTHPVTHHPAAHPPCHPPTVTRAKNTRAIYVTLIVGSKPIFWHIRKQARWVDCEEIRFEPGSNEFGRSLGPRPVKSRNPSAISGVGREASDQYIRI